MRCYDVEEIMDFHNEELTCWFSLGFVSQFDIQDALYVVCEVGPGPRAEIYLEHLDQGMSCEHGLQSLKFENSELFFQFNKEGIAELKFEPEIAFRFQPEQLEHSELIQVIERICSYSPYSYPYT